MRTVRIIPAAEPRVETGAIQFGNDWPGYFIRGDNAAGLMLNLREVEYVLEQHGIMPEVALAWAQIKGVMGDIATNTIVQPTLVEHPESA